MIEKQFFELICCLRLLYVDQKIMVLRQRCVVAVVCFLLLADEVIGAEQADCKPEAEQITLAIQGKETTSAEVANVAICTKNKTCCGPIKVIETSEGVIIQAYRPSAWRCGEGTMLTNWFPTESIWDRGGRIFLYGFALFYCFLGIAIIADKFMVAIEVITAKEKTTKVRLADGTEQEVTVLVWNETVANLTLMALGSSAPEILLAVGETVAALGKPPEDSLGPACIVGSAAFNLLVITAICMVALPGEDTRKIDNIGVFNVSAFFSIFAYVWMYLVVMDEQVSVLEALLTVLLLFILCGVSFAEDQNWKWCRKNPTEILFSKKVQVEGHDEVKSKYVSSFSNETDADDRRRLQLANLIDGENNINDDESAKNLARKLLAEKPKSAMHYRINARRGLTGAKRLVTGTNSNNTDESYTALLQKLHIPDEEKAKKEGRAIFEWSASRYDVYEKEKHVRLTIRREGAINKTSQVCFETNNGSALAGVSYQYQSGVLDFGLDETEKTVDIIIVDDHTYSPDENFFCRLYTRNKDTVDTIGSTSITEIMIINDNDPGTFGFSGSKIHVDEHTDTYKLMFIRSNGSDGIVSIQYMIENGSAVNGVDYTCANTGELIFAHHETSQFLLIKIANLKGAKLSRSFKAKILVDPESGAKEGLTSSATIEIVTDSKLAQAVENAAIKLQKQLESLSVGSASWMNQFSEAVNLHGEDGEEPSSMDYFMHFLCFLWKVLFAIVPPTSYAGGWATFVVCLMMIGGLTVFVGDVAGTFGCLLGISKTVTAITFVALGTSLPDTFASYVAAKDAPNADASIGNVTGSNSVNVFLGQGIPWLIASLYYSSRGEIYHVKAGSLGFSLAVFLPCATVCIIILYIRRFTVGAELGGKCVCKVLSAVLMCGLWGIYILMSTLQSEGIIAGF